MLKYQINEVEGFQSALHGMRNPMNSWDKQDSEFCRDYFYCNGFSCDKKCGLHTKNNDEYKHGFVMLKCWGVKIGPNDLRLARNLVLSGSDHAKFLRMIQVYADITAPLYWWKEYDTYKIGTVANSCSTMHKITEKEFTRQDFSCEHLVGTTFSEADNFKAIKPLEVLDETIAMLNECRKLYLACIESGDQARAKMFWWQLIQLLPSSYNQKRTVMLNYAVLRNIYFARKEHKLEEWHTFCDMIRELPYADDLITITKEEVVQRG